EPSLHVLTITPTISDDDETSLTALAPHHWLQIASSLGFTTASYQIIDRNDLDAFIQRCFNEIEKEGYVLYYLKNSNGSVNTIGMAKVKTVWYSMLLALRKVSMVSFTSAKMKNGRSMEEIIKFAHKRFSEIQTWLEFNNEHLTLWNKLSEEFLHWMNGEINTNSEERIDLHNQFPVIWNRFLKDTGNQFSIFTNPDIKIGVGKEAGHGTICTREFITHRKKNVNKR
ncbi:unnamed protein product, partial [Meganyctiphanes norvegica]